jgi:hypothetical protein
MGRTRIANRVVALILFLMPMVVPAAAGYRNDQALADYVLHLPLVIHTPSKAYAPIAMHNSSTGGREDIFYNSGCMIWNLGDEEATIIIEYYNQEGIEGVTIDDTIPAKGSKTYFPLHPGEGFNGSIVISSDHEIVVICHLLAEGAVRGLSATSTTVSVGAPTVYLPTIMRGDDGLDTWFNVQNVGTQATHVTVTYLPGEAGNEGVMEETDIPPGASYTFDQAANAALGERFMGSAVVTSDGQPLVATVVQVGSSENFMVLMSYNGFIAGSSTVSLPLVMANNAGFYTSIHCQNGGTMDTEIAVKYSRNTVGTWQPTDDSAPVGPGRSVTFIQSGERWPERYVGAATVTNSQNQPLMCVVNQMKRGATPVDPDFGSAYEGFSPAQATDKLYALLISAAGWGYVTGLQIQNVDTEPVAITFLAPCPGVCPLERWVTVRIDPGESVSLIGPHGAPSLVTATGRIVGIVNEFNPELNDQFSTYSGLNY